MTGGGFVTTNFACWLSNPAASHALAGLWTCYREGLPYARHTTFATLLFSGLMVLVSFAILALGVLLGNPQYSYV